MFPRTKLRGTSTGSMIGLPSNCLSAVPFLKKRSVCAVPGDDGTDDGPLVTSLVHAGPAHACPGNLTRRDAALHTANVVTAPRHCSQAHRHCCKARRHCCRAFDPRARPAQSLSGWAAAAVLKSMALTPALQVPRPLPVRSRIRTPRRVVVPACAQQHTHTGTGRGTRLCTRTRGVAGAGLGARAVGVRALARCCDAHVTQARIVAAGGAAALGRTRQAPCWLERDQ
eukprot:3465255-Rhodomonas_salina.5